MRSRSSRYLDRKHPTHPKEWPEWLVVVVVLATITLPLVVITSDRGGSMPMYTAFGLGVAIILARFGPDRS